MRRRLGCSACLPNASQVVSGSSAESSISGADQTAAADFAELAEGADGRETPDRHEPELLLGHRRVALASRGRAGRNHGSWSKESSPRPAPSARSAQSAAAVASSKGRANCLTRIRPADYADEPLTATAPLTVSLDFFETAS